MNQHNRMMAPLRRAVMVAAFGVLSIASWPAHAEFAPGGSGSQATSVSTKERMAQLEQAVADLKSQVSALASAPTAVPEKAAKASKPVKDASGLPAMSDDERERVQAELTYEVLGTMNGMNLVRDNGKRFLLSSKELAAYDLKARLAAYRKIKSEELSLEQVFPPDSGVPLLSAPPVPPPASTKASAAAPAPTASAPISPNSRTKARPAMK